MKKERIITFLQRAILVFLILYIVLPLLVPIIYSFSTLWMDILPEGFTVQWYLRIFERPKYYQGLVTSLLVAFSAVALDTFICVPAAYAINRLRGRIGGFLGSAFKIFPLLFPPIVVGTGFVQAFNRPPLALSGTVILAVFAHATLGFPYMFRNVLAAFQTIDERTLSEAAASLGANLWQRFRYVLIPNVTPGILSGALLVFALSMGEFEVTTMIAGFGWRTMPLLLYRSLIDDIRAASAISGILIATSIAAFIGMTILSSRVGGGKVQTEEGMRR
mgnify:FL=1